MKNKKVKKNKPVKLDKIEPLVLKYEESTVYSTGAIFITLLVIVAFRIGTDNINYLFWSCL